jgi:hypothetical protein
MARNKFGGKITKAWLLKERARLRERLAGTSYLAERESLTGSLLTIEKMLGLLEG